ncbi:permease [Heliomicrobium modesticaldum Ice1]|uniref:Permease n=1 Tax=Heliobacterium modesticaldum (strain ATCC 51547 / Ice1) TaxID=498761 RepID=B0TB49_HELMI|nr:permease [Heliomicrobium modesticaldum]ABZ83776.1 permease [Heliomicrobium modesticaldum Ice1]
MFEWIADLVVYQWIGLTKGEHLTEALHFFIYDVMKILFLLTVIIYAVSIIRSFFPPERTKKILSHKREFLGNIVAALLGVVTPFCSCSAVPMFIGLVESGVPLGVTFSFLISSPMVNEVALVMLFGLFGWKIAGIYMATGLTVAVVGGMMIGRAKMEDQVADYVYQVKLPETEIESLTWQQRHDYALQYTKDILKKIWIYVIVAIAIGGLIHGYAPEDFLVRYAGPDNLFAVPLAVLIGVPLYSNAAGTIPIVHVLMEKGMAVGTVLAFMMAVTALSVPEMIILKQVLKPKLIGVFVGIMAVTITFVGYLFNAIL